MSQGIKKGLTNYGDQDFSKYLRNSFAKSMGYSENILSRPVIGISYPPSGFNNCHRHFPELLDAVKRGVLTAGGLPLEFPTISLGEVFLSPTSLKFRNLMSMDVEEMIRAQPMDTVILMGGCDKTIPAQLMGAASAGKPTVQLVAGPMMTGSYEGVRLGACTDCRRFWELYRSGEITKNQIDNIEDRLATTAGTCPVMGTASTMACVAETLGITLPGTATIPAVHADRIRAAEATGEIAVKLLQNQITPLKLITKKSVENALRVVLAIGGSTNAIIHITAIAGRLGIKVSLETLNKLSDTTPVLVNLKPTGQHYMEDFFSAGGLGAVLRQIKPLLHLECINILGQTLEERLKDEKNYTDHSVISSFDDPIEPEGGLVALFGTLAPSGAILKRSAADKSLFEKKGRAIVFNSLEDLSNRIDDPELNVSKNDFLILQNAGPKSVSGMPESGYLPIPKKLLKNGVKDIVRISDARMSGTAFGTVILHVSPESAVGGPLGLVRNGDEIQLSVKERKLDLLVPHEALERRRQEKLNIESEINIPSRGYAKLYFEHVLQAEKGCDFDFLQFN